MTPYIDPIRLLGLLKSVMFQHNSRMYRATAIIELINPSLMAYSRYISDSEYLENFWTKLSVLAPISWGQLTVHQGMIHDELANAGVTNFANAINAQVAQQHRLLREGLRQHFSS